MDHVKANDIAVGNDETDVPDGILKPCRGRKIAPLKLIIMSASLDARGFSEYFGGARALHVQGRQYPVDILYTTKPQTDYLDSAVRAIFQIHLDEAPGDILVFLTGQEEIESIEGLLREHLKQLTEGSQKLLVHPLFSSLPSEKQLKVFKRAPDGFRKVILATNIAEMSVTIPGIKYVIDPGLVKVRSYSPDSGIESLIVVKTSKPQALQRSGRAGREGPGECFRLYPESMFAGLDDSMVPEIKRCNLSNVILQLNALGVDDIIGFDFMEKPDSQIRENVERMGLRIASCGDDMLQLRRCLAASYFLNAVLKQPDGTYRILASGQIVDIHPTSVLRWTKSECIVFYDLIETSRTYIGNITRIDYLWLPELAPQCFSLKD